MGQSPVQTVPACPVQIRAHHHIDVYTDVNHPGHTQFKYQLVLFIHIYMVTYMVG